MVSRKLFKLIVALILSAFALVLMCLDSVEIPMETFMGAETKPEWTGVAKALAQNRKSAASASIIETNS